MPDIRVKDYKRDGITSLLRAAIDEIGAQLGIPSLYHVSCVENPLAKFVSFKLEIEGLAGLGVDNGL